MADQPVNTPPPGLDEFLATAPALPAANPPAGQLLSQPQTGEESAPPLPPGLDAFIEPEMKEAKYGGGTEQAKTFLEGAASGATFGLSTGIETALGVNPEDIRGRREANPGTHMAGQATGLVGSAFVPGYGAANVLTKAGSLGAKAVGLGVAESTVAKIGSAAIKGAIENAIFQGGDEVSKILSQAPEQTVDTALTDIGLSALLGAGISAPFGAISPLWKVAGESKLGGMLHAMSDKMGGIEGVIPDEVERALKTINTEISPEVKASMIQNPGIRQAFQTLQDSATNSGLKAQDALKNFKSQMSDVMVETLGKTPEQINNLEMLSENKVGEQIKETLINRLKAEAEPITKSYEKISNKFKGMELPEDIKAELNESIAKSLDAGVSGESAEAKLVQRVLRETPGLKNLEQLRNYASGIGNETKGIAKQELWGISRKLRGALHDAEEKSLLRSVEANAPELLDEHLATNSAYKQLKNSIGDLNDRLSVGPHTGPKTFINALKDMDGEAVLRRLSPKGKADIIAELASKFPEVAEQVRSYHLDQVLKQAAKHAGPDEIINPKALIKTIKGLSPEMREFVLPQGSADKLEAIQTLLSKIPEKVGKSGTPQGIDALMSHVPSSAAGMLTMLMGRGPIEGIAVGYLTKLLGRDAPDAARLALLKFLGSNQPINSTAFKTMVDFMTTATKGNSLVNQAVKNVMKAGREVLPQSFMPKEKDRAKLDKRLKELQADSSSLLDVGGEVGHYLPDHGGAIGKTAASAVNFLNSARPGEIKPNPLDRPLKPNAMQTAEWNKTLDIAQQPLIVLDKVKKGTVTPSDIKALQNMYPSLYNRLSQQLTDQMIDAAAKNQEIPYVTKIGMSMFLAQPLDSTMTPAGIMGAQPQANNNTQDQQMGANVKPPAASSVKSLSKMPASYMTPSQASAAHRQQK